MDFAGESIINKTIKNYHEKKCTVFVAVLDVHKRFLDVGVGRSRADRLVLIWETMIPNIGVFRLW